MTQRDTRALILGGAAVLAAVVVFRVMPWVVRSAVALRTRALEQAATLTRAEEVLAREPQVRDSLAGVLGRIVALAPQLVDGRSGAEAQASLSSLVSLVANRQQVKVVRLDPLPDSSAGAFTRVALHAELEGDVAGLTRLLKAVETGVPLLSVTSLSVTAPDANARTEALRIEMDVAGYYLVRGGP